MSDPREIAALAEDWDRLALGRGPHADLFDSHAWLASWLAAAAPEQARLLRIPAVLIGGRPAALLPLVERRPGRAEAAGFPLRHRYRPVVGSPDPDPEHLALLAEEVARAGFRSLALRGLPSRDPAVQLLLTGLRRAGYRIWTTPQDSECLALRPGPWPEHRNRFHSFERSVMNLVNRAHRVGAVRLAAFGPLAAPIAEGYARYQALHARSWKGPMQPIWRDHRRELMTRTSARGWPRVYVLYVSDVPLAAHIWFLVGGSAISYSTVYDARVRALGPGTILQWLSHEAVFAEGIPAVVDHLPGQGSQKDRLGPDHPPLLGVHAERGRRIPWSPHASPPAIRAARRAWIRWLERRRAGAPRDPAGRLRTKLVTIRPGSGKLAAAALELDERTEFYLAVAGGHASAAEMRRAWTPGDLWWRIGEGPAAVARVESAGNGRFSVREVILVNGGEGRVRDVLASLADGLGAALEVRVPHGDGGRDAPAARIRRALLPWPPAPPARRAGRS